MGPLLMGPPTLDAVVAQYLALGSIPRLAEAWGTSRDHARAALALAGYTPSGRADWKWAGGRGTQHRFG